MSLPTAEEMLFSLKCYLGAMLALYIAYAIGLPRPFWAMMTAYILVSSPWAGTIRSKAIYRIAGTFLGSAATVLMVPRLANYPVLMTGALSLWVGACLYVSLLDRTPRAYVFMLAGYTAALIGFPSLAHPDGIFDTALARMEEIGLAIVCVSFMHSVVFPRSIGPVLLGKLDGTLRDARAWIADTLGRAAAARRNRERRALAADITQLRLLSTHLPYEVGNLRWTAGAVRAAQERITALTPLVAAVEDRRHALEAEGTPLPAPLATALDAVQAWIAAGDQGDPARALRLRAALRRATPPLEADADWRTLLIASLAARAHALVDAYADCLALRADIGAAMQGRPRARLAHAVPAVALHRDHGIALRSALAAMIAIAASSAFWILTAWPNGTAVAMMAAVFSCFFATMDDPVPTIRAFCVWFALSTPLAALYLLAILPALHSFEMLALAIFPTAFVLGIYCVRPKSALRAMALWFGVIGALSLQDTHTADLVSFLDGMLAQLGGIAVAAIVAALCRRIGAETAARRIQAANWRELATLAAAPRAATRAGYRARMLDRIGLLAPRLAAAGTREDATTDDALRELRLGGDIAVLQRVRPHLPAGSVRALLRALAALFRARLAGDVRPPPPDCLARIDRALADVAAQPERHLWRTQALVALVGLRRGLFPDAHAYRAPLSAGASA